MMGNSNENTATRYNIAVNMRPTGDAVVTATDNINGRREVYPFTPREVDLLLLATDNDPSLVTKAIADYTLFHLFAPEIKIQRDATDIIRGAKKTRRRKLDPMGTPPPAETGVEYPGATAPTAGTSLEGLELVSDDSIPLLGSGASPRENAEAPPAKSREEKLQERLELAVRQENYHEAARLRDEIRKLKGT